MASGILGGLQQDGGWLPWLAVTAIAAGGAMLVAGLYLQVLRLRAGRMRRRAGAAGNAVPQPSPQSTARPRATVAPTRTLPPETLARRRAALQSYLQRIADQRLRLHAALDELETLQQRQAASARATAGSPAALGDEVDLEYLNRERVPALAGS